MRFELNHTFDSDPDAVAHALLDLDFQATLSEIGGLKERTVLSQDSHSGGRVTRYVRCVLALEISGTARRFLGDQDPSWVQEEHWDPDNRRWDWVIKPDVAKELLSASGHVTLEGSGIQTARTVAGEVRVHVPIYGGRVEGWIIDGISRAYDEEAVRLAAWMARTRKAPARPDP